jgi:hypothetical protein
VKKGRKKVEDSVRFLEMHAVLAINYRGVVLINVFQSGPS